MIEISVIIPTNRSATILEPCLEALLGQTLPREIFEVIVVNDGCHHDLTGLTDRLSTKGLKLRLYSVAQGGPARARNYGANLARGRLLAFTDDDCIPESQWLEAFAITANSEDQLLGGKVMNLLDKRPCSAASQLLVDYLLEYYNSDKLNAQFFTSNNLFVDKDRYLEIGGFDENFPLNAAEDRDFCTRWRESGKRLIVIDAAVVGHAHELNLRSFIKQHFKYGQGAANYWQSRRSRNNERRRSEPVAFYAGLLSYPFRKYQLFKAIEMAGLLMLTQVANTLGYLKASRS